jgi:hypothetical protein
VILFAATSVKIGTPVGRARPCLALALLALASNAGCILSLDLLGLAEKAKKSQKEAATGRPADLEAWEPAELQLPERKEATVTAFRVRVYADEQYRLANVRWQEHIKALVSDASGQLEGSFGAKLAIESIRPWKRQGAKDSTLQLLHELEEADQGDEVDWVIGFVSPLGLLTTSIHEIGMASLPGKHFVLRGIDDREEAASLAKHFGDLDEQKRDEFLVRRRRHKELVVFLHEWLHNLAALHHSDREDLLHPAYAHQQCTVGRDNAEVVRLALKARIAARSAGGPPDYGEVRDYVASAAGDAWYAADREQLLATLPAQRRPPAAPERPRAVAASLSPAVSLSPAPPPATAAPGPWVPLPGLLATSLPPGLVPLRAAVDGERWEEAITGCLEAAPPAQGLAGQSWAGHLAELCARSGMIGIAEQRLSAGGLTSVQEANVRQVLVAARRRYGVPPGRPGLAPEAEAARARIWFALHASLEAKELDRAEGLLKPALKRYPDDPGLAALSCETAVRRSWSGDQLRVPCERAVTLWNEMPRALFWSALAQANTGNRRLAITRLVQSKALEPSFDGPWKVLSDIYRFEGKRTELADLRAEYQARFGQPLK